MISGSMGFRHWPGYGRTEKNLPREPEVNLDVPEVCQIGTSILRKTLERQVGPSETKGPTMPNPPEKKNSEQMRAMFHRDWCCKSSQKYPKVMKTKTSQQIWCGKPLIKQSQKINKTYPVDTCLLFLGVNMEPPKPSLGGFKVLVE